MCGLFGVVAYKVVEPSTMGRLSRALGKASEVRGTDAGGFSYVENDKVKFIKNSGAISKSGVLALEPNTWGVMGHTRLGTGASELDNFNNHPFPSTVKAYTMAHNGVITNDNELAITFNLPDTKVATDSYIVVRMLDHIYNGVLSMDNIKNVSELLSGTFNLTFQDKDSVWLVKNNNPLHIIKINDLGLYAYASTQDILFDALSEFYDKDFTEYLLEHKGDSFGALIKLSMGDIIRIKNDGTIEKGNFTPKKTIKDDYGYSSKYGRISYGYDYGYDYSYNHEYPDDCDTCQTYNPQASYYFDDAFMNEIYGVDAPNDIALVFNGTEYEPVNDDGTETFFSKFLGKFITVDKTDIMVRLSHKDVVEPYTKDFFVPYFINNSVYNSCMSIINKNNNFKNMIKDFTSKVKTNFIKEDIIDVFSSYIIMTWYYGMGHKVKMTHDDVDKLVKVLPLYNRKDCYEYAQLMLSYFIDTNMESEVE